MSPELQLTENDYKKLSLNFRKVASRFLQTNFTEANDNLERFLIFIEESPVILQFIQYNNTVEYNIKNIIENTEYHDKYKLPVRTSEEIAFVYQFLKYIFANDIKYFDIIPMSYRSGKKIQNTVDNFNQQVVKPLVDHIVTYLGEMAIDMGLDKSSSTQFNIQDFRGQLNHAERESSITAHQVYNESNIEDLKEIGSQFIQELLNEKSDLGIDKEETKEFLEAAIEEVESEKPKKTIIKTAIEKVKNVNELVTGGTALYTSGEKLLSLLQQHIG
ncbi:hypothetical protein [Bacillus sp. AFS033286]|uniref:hypothetical protein n=1 Tax=Bacillus sp. AFS033286 TaxID=2033498 RepID=UPI000BFD3CE5|nr:hypothetical protein [Bacillus sp. AFS033286]PGX11828.1 hypothetical protein COE07_11180 [Bacillus sp. AFS033286]